MAFPDAWGPFFLISLQRRGTTAQTAVQFASIVDPNSLELPLGDHPHESMVNAAGGRIWKQDPEEDTEISFDLVGSTELDSTAAKGLFQQFVGATGTVDPNVYDTTDPLATATTWTAGDNRARDRFLISVLWTNDQAATTASGTTAAATEAMRFYGLNAVFVSMKMSHGDNSPKFSATFKLKPFNKAGTMKMYAWESGDTTPLVAFGDTGATGAYSAGTTYTTVLYPD